MALTKTAIAATNDSPKTIGRMLVKFKREASGPEIANPIPIPGNSTSASCSSGMPKRPIRASTLRDRVAPTQKYPDRVPRSCNPLER